MTQQLCHCQCNERIKKLYCTLNPRSRIIMTVLDEHAPTIVHATNWYLSLKLVSVHSSVSFERAISTAVVRGQKSWESTTYWTAKARKTWSIEKTLNLDRRHNPCYGQ